MKRLPYASFKDDGITICGLSKIAVHSAAVIQHMCNNHQATGCQSFKKRCSSIGKCMLGIFPAEARAFDGLDESAQIQSFRVRRELTMATPTIPRLAALYYDKDA